MTPEFQEFPKMARLSRGCFITEKIDGTNACIFIADGYHGDPMAIAEWYDEETRTDMVMYAGSRTRWITPAADNYGFAAWAKQNAESLKGLGQGRHFGEWWGQGIQRRYGLEERRFSLFNTGRWTGNQPSCCHVVPVLYAGEFTTDASDGVMKALIEKGSRAAPGFMKPEGIVVFHLAGNVGFKKTVEKDDQPKSLAI